MLLFSISSRALSLVRLTANTWPTSRRLFGNPEVCGLGRDAIGGADNRHYLDCPRLRSSTSACLCLSGFLKGLGQVPSAPRPLPKSRLSCLFGCLRVHGRICMSDFARDILCQYCGQFSWGKSLRGAMQHFCTVAAANIPRSRRWACPTPAGCRARRSVVASSAEVAVCRSPPSPKSQDRLPTRSLLARLVRARCLMPSQLSYLRRSATDPARLVMLICDVCRWASLCLAHRHCAHPTRPLGRPPRRCCTSRWESANGLSRVGEPQSSWRAPFGVAAACRRLPPLDAQPST